MNAQNAKDYLPLVQAMTDGKILQVMTVNGWSDIENEVSFCYGPDKYRIKPEPKEVWFNRYPSHDAGPYATREAAVVCGYHNAVQVCYREVV